MSKDLVVEYNATSEDTIILNIGSEVEVRNHEGQKENTDEAMDKQTPSDCEKEQENDPGKLNATAPVDEGAITDPPNWMRWKKDEMSKCFDCS